MRWEDELGPLKDLAIGGRERGAGVVMPMDIVPGSHLAVGRQPGY